MGRILVIYPQKGFLDLLKRVLTGLHEVDGFQEYKSAADCLAGGASYDALLCGLDSVPRTIEIFEDALARSPGTRLIPVAKNEAEVLSFCEQWNSVARRKQRNPLVGKEWLRPPCTAGDILAMFPVPAKSATQDASARPVGPQPSASGVTEPGARNPKQVSSPAAGTLIDGYRLIHPIGQGGFGTLWLAANESTGRRVAVKCIQGEEQVPQELAALRKYVYVAASSENLLQVEHINRDELRLWLVTALADSMTGGDTADSYKALSLANQLEARGHLPDEEAARIGICLVSALLVLHRASLLHGDVAPGNVLSIRGRWVLADPGLVRFLGEPGICRNQRYYPKPQPVRPCDDLYAVGVILWEMTSGVAEMVAGTERLRLDGNMLRFLSQSELPLAKVICRAVAENPEQRYMNAAEMLHDLEALTAKVAAEPEVQCTLYNLPRLRALRTNFATPPLA